MRCARVLIGTLLLCLMAAPGARAAKGDGEDARAFAAATKAFRAGVLAQKATIETGANRLTRDPLCLEALRHVPADDKPFGAAVALSFEYSFEAQVAPLVPAWNTFADALAAVQVRDPALRSGRAAQRRAARVGALVQPAPADICVRLDAWRQAGYPAQDAPVIDDPGFKAATALPRRDQRRINRAGRRMRALGISRTVVRLWRGEDTELFKGIDLGTGEIPIGEANQ